MYTAEELATRTIAARAIKQAAARVKSAGIGDVIKSTLIGGGVGGALGAGAGWLSAPEDREQERKRMLRGALVGALLGGTAGGIAGSGKAAPVAAPAPALSRAATPQVKYPEAATAGTKELLDSVAAGKITPDARGEAVLKALYEDPASNWYDPVRAAAPGGTAMAVGGALLHDAVKHKVPVYSKIKAFNEQLKPAPFIVPKPNPGRIDLIKRTLFKQRFRQGGAGAITFLLGLRDLVNRVSEESAK
jgi:hypothetical protein